jgi:dihydroneopterin aldolase
MSTMAKRKQKIRVVIEIEIDSREAEKAADALESNLDYGGAQESLLDSVYGAGVRSAESVSATVDYAR